MELELTSDQELFLETTRKFVDSECPIARVRELIDDPVGFDRDTWRRGAELGWTALLVPEEHGGGSISGAPLLDAVIVAEELGRMVQPGPFLAVNVVASVLATAGSPSQQAEFLAGLASGEVIATWCLAEPAGTWAASGVALEATPDGDDVVLHGTKSFVQDAHVADVLLVVARTGDGLTQVLAPREAEGVTVEPLRCLDLARRLSQVRFDGVRVPAASVVGTVGGAAADVERAMQVALALQVAETVGVTDRVFDFTLEWAQDRVAFGRPIGSYQALKHRFADMKMWLEASKGTATAVAHAVAEQRDDAAELVSVAKAYVGDASIRIIQDCVQMHGGIGVTWEHDLHLYLRRATSNAALYGSPREHRERLASLLGM